MLKVKQEVSNRSICEVLGMVMVIKRELRDRVAPASHFGIFSAQNPFFVKVKGWLTSLLYPRGLTMWLPIPNCGSDGTP